MTNKELLEKLKKERVFELPEGLREKAQKLKNEGFLKRVTGYWYVTEKGRMYIEKKKLNPDD